MHLYLKIPGEVNMKLNVAPGARLPEFHTLPFAVEVCVTPPLFVQVTVSPTCALKTRFGVNMNSVIETWKVILGFAVACLVDA